mmetsp:Transcript_103979/g.335272  ORF Transcript_103979/g.335272 Transcript_103979/m.335272 type:complete len:225 (+) Transcript_103979:730-1404(+)
MGSAGRADARPEQVLVRLPPVTCLSSPCPATLYRHAQTLVLLCGAGPCASDGTARCNVRRPPATAAAPAKVHRSSGLGKSRLGLRWHLSGVLAPASLVTCCGGCGGSSRLGGALGCLAERPAVAPRGLVLRALALVSHHVSALDFNDVLPQAFSAVHLFPAWLAPVRAGFGFAHHLNLRCLACGWLCVSSLPAGFGIMHGLSSLFSGSGTRRPVCRHGTARQSV